MFNPRLSHEKALKRIGRYLKATRDRGLITRPFSEFTVEAWYKTLDDPTYAKSKTGFLLTVSGCRILWIPKLQQKMALSTTEIEINALAHCYRELFPVLDVTINVGDDVGLPTKDIASMSVSVPKDDAGALILAHTLPSQCTHQSKYCVT